MVTQYVLKDSNLLGDALAIVIVPLSVLGFFACYLGQGQYQKARNDLIAMLRTDIDVPLAPTGRDSESSAPSTQTTV